MPLAAPVEIAPVVLVRELASGWSYAFPVAAPNLVCRARDPQAALAAQERFLTAYLEKQPAFALADFMFSETTTLLEVSAVVPRADLGQRLRIETPITVPCLCTPSKQGTWVHLIPFRGAVFIEEGEDLQRRIVQEIEKAAVARGLQGPEYRALLPPAAFALERVSISVERKTIEDLSARAAARRKKSSQRSKDAARKLLGSIGTDLVRGPRHPPIVGRDKEVAALAALPDGPERLSVALVGAAGAGKSAVVCALAEAARRTEYTGSNPLRSRPLFATSGAALVAGQSGFGQLEQRIGDVMRAAEELDAIIYFDNLGDLLSGRAGSIEDMIGAIRPFVADDRVRLPGELTPDQLEHYEKLHVGFFSGLSRVAVEPMSKDATSEVLQQRRAYFEQREPSRPNLAAAALPPLVELSDRYLRYESFPGKSVRLYEELRTMHESETAADGTPRAITAFDVYRAFATRSGIPLFLLRDEQSLKYEEIEKFFSKSVIGQRDAIARVAQTLCTVKAQLQPPGKPLANFLFVGPTGIGKTEVAKTLARFLFGSADRMLRFDMSEYMDAFAAVRLIRGTASDEGELTRKVRQQPFCVLLLDEIEKAHPSVFDLLLAVCGEGRLTDARGHTTYFHNAIIIMTSNLGAAHRRPDPGFGADAEPAQSRDDRYYLEQVDKHFRPEFVNRIDRVIPFRPLTQAEISDVARVVLERVRERDGLVGNSIAVEISDAALDWTARTGYSEKYGARAFRRHLEAVLVTPLSALVAELASEVHGGRITVRHQDEDAAPNTDGGGWVAERAFEALRLCVYKPPAKQSKAATHDLAFAAELRRRADRCMETSIVEELRERLQYLVADLAGAQTRRGSLPAASLAATAAEHGRLAELVGAADAAAEAVASAEELAMSAALEGESTKLFRDEASEAFTAFETAFVRLVAGGPAPDGITFIVRRTGAPQGLRRWLVPFLQGATERGWDVTIHRHQDREGVGDWPSSRQWGPPRAASWCLEKLRNEKLQKMASDWRQLLIRVSGPLAAGLLHLELGVTRFDPWGDVKQPSFFELFLVTHRAAIKPAELETESFALPDPIGTDVLRRTAPARLWFDASSVRVPTSQGRMEFDDPLGYWRCLERVSFAMVCQATLTGRDLLDE